MGNTCASSHIIMYGQREALLPKTIQAISRAYTSIGYERGQKPIDGGKHVVLLAPAGERFVSIFDSTNAQMDDGELKDVALKASKSMHSAAVFTSLYDSDTYEFVLFSNGKQVDCLMEDADANISILKQMKPALRSKNWTSYFGRPIKSEDVELAAGGKSAFADNNIAALSQLIGLSKGQSQMQYIDVKDNTDDETKHLFFKKKEQVETVITDGKPSFSQTYDPFFTRMISVFPASWPTEIGTEISPTWLVLSNGAGFANAKIDITIEGPNGLSPQRIFVNGCKFHNGQIVGALETTPPPPSGASEEDLVEYSQTIVKNKNFDLTELPGAMNNSRSYSAELRNLNIPNKTPQRTTQILIVVQLHLVAQNAGDWTIDVSLRPNGAEAPSSGQPPSTVDPLSSAEPASSPQLSSRIETYRLPKLRIETVTKRWVPVISGLNEKTNYQLADLTENKTHFNNNILNEMRSAQERNAKSLRLEHPAYISNVAITRKDQSSLDHGKAYLEEWLRPLSSSHPDAQLKLLTERQMTEAGSVSKTKKTITVKELLGTKAWDKIFAVDSGYQTVKIDMFAAEFDHPIAGIGLQFGFEEREKYQQRSDQVLAKTLQRMRGRGVPNTSTDPTLHLYNWVINHEWCHAWLGTTVEQMSHALNQLAATDKKLLQAWHSACTWLTEFDDAGEYRRTLYEDSGVLNWFRGILPEDGGGLNTIKMSEGWCQNVLRMVAPQMWLCKNLIEQIDRTALSKVATTMEKNGVFRIELKPESHLDELELALLPVLPVESARISLRS